MRPVLICLGLLLAFAVPRSAQRLSVPSPEKIRSMLLDKTPYEKLFLEHRENELADLEKKLGMESDETPCRLFESVSIDYVALEPGRTHAVIVARSERCWNDFLTVIERVQRGQWRLVKTYRLFSKYDHPRIAFPELISTGTHEILIGRSAVGANGTGIWQYDTMVVKLFGGDPQVIFDEPNEANLSIPMRGENADLFQHSKWYLVPSGNPGRNKMDIVEDQILCVNGTKVERWWWHSYDDTVRRFRGVLVDRSSATDWIKKSSQFHTTTEKLDDRFTCK